MKTVYFVRHGESEGNATEVYQAVDSPLTEKGRKQARMVADRCSRLPIQAIISSTQLRAKNTANIIAETTGHPVEFSDLFRERRKPKALNGKPFSDPGARALNERWWLSLIGEGSRAEDGENFEDICMRAGQGLEHLAARGEQNILVSTHESFLRILIARALFGESVSGQEMKVFMRALGMENTGITVLRHNADDPTLPWTLWIWNDHAHLG